MKKKRNSGSGGIPYRLSRWFYAAHLLAAAVGVSGLFVPPSPSVAVVLGEAGAAWAVWVWSLGFGVTGVLGTLARWRDWPLAEAAAIDTMSAMFLLWAIMVVVASPASGTQAALGFTLAATFMHGSARSRRRRVAATVAAIRDAADNVQAGE